MNFDVGEATEGLENELWRRWSNRRVGEWAMLILQPFRHFTDVTAHSPTLPSLNLRHSSFSNSSVASPTLQLILQPFLRFSHVTGSSLTSPGEPPMWLYKVISVWTTITTANSSTYSIIRNKLISCHWILLKRKVNIPKNVVFLYVYLRF